MSNVIDLANGNDQPITIIKDGYEVKCRIRIDYLNLSPDGEISAAKVKLYSDKTQSLTQKINH